MVFDGVIELDPCSNEHSLVGALREFRLPEHDGLIEAWDASTIYVNPPYGTDKARGTRILDWFEKAVDAADAGAEVVMLVPVATNTTHWKRFVFPRANAICFLSAPRLRFHLNGHEDRKGAPMACATIYYGTHPDRFAQAFETHGAVIRLNPARLSVAPPATAA